MPNKPMNPAGTKPIARRRAAKPPMRRYGGVAKRLSEQDQREQRRNAGLKPSNGQWKILAERSLATAWWERLAAEVFDDAIDPARVAAFRAQSNHQMFLAVTPKGVTIGQVRGQINVQPDGPAQLYLDNLGVTPDYKRQGVGAALVNALCRWARDQHSAALCWLGTETDNPEAAGFYRDQGFSAGDMLMFERSLTDSLDV